MILDKINPLEEKNVEFAVIKLFENEKWCQKLLFRLTNNVFKQS